MTSTLTTFQLNAKQLAYKKLTDARSAQTAEAFMKMLGQSALEIDLSTTPPFQMECLLRVLHSVPTFKTVRVRNSERAHKPMRRSEAASSKQQQQRAPSTTNPESEAQKSLIPGLSRNYHLVTLELDAIPPSLVKRLPSMVKGSAASLKHLLVKNVTIDDHCLAKLMQTIATSEIYDLQLVNCGLGESCGKELKEIISIHNIRRDVAKWQDKLRDQENGSNSSSIGLLHINLSKNRLQDNAIRPIIEALVDDKWVRSLDLTSNSLSNSIIGDLIDLLKANSSLGSVVVDDNDDLDHGMVALLQAMLAQRQNEKHEFEAAGNSTDAGIYPASKRRQQTAPKKVRIPSAKAFGAGSSSELIKSIEKMFNNQAGSADALTREQFREMVNAVQNLMDLLGVAQDQLNQMATENEDLKGEIKRLAQKQGNAAPFRAKPQTPAQRLKKKLSKSSREIDHLITDENVDGIVEVVEIFESALVQLHQYMDCMECSENGVNSQNEDLQLVPLDLLKQ